MEASIKLPRANGKDQNPHTQKRQSDVKRGNMSMDGSPKVSIELANSFIAIAYTRLTPDNL